jgi:hexosaminidase
MDNMENALPTTVSPLTVEITQLDQRPRTIPALKAWEPADGAYIFSPQARILLDPVSASNLDITGAVLADDIQQLSGQVLPVLVTDTARPGDVVLQLDSTLEVPEDEGYLLEVGETVVIRARTDDGVFNGTRTLLQLLRQGKTIQGGVARDWPDYPERSLMVDMGRKYFTVGWLENHIRDLAYLKYNYFHFHLSDNYGFRLESERHPEIVSPDYYTKEQMYSLIALARRYHITIVPEIDMPGHMDTILAHHPELQLVNEDGKRWPGDIDLSQEGSYQLMRDIMEEYIPLFPGPYWHIGADEYIMFDKYERYPQLLTYAREHYGPTASAKDTYLGFVNWANEIVKAHGKVTRAWNDGLHSGAAVKVAGDIIYEHWLRSGLEPREIVDLDLSIMNGNADYLYYVLREGNTWRALPDVLYGKFEPLLFHGVTTVEQPHPRYLGAKLHVWCDEPEVETEQQVAAGIKHSLRALAQKNWGSPNLVPDYAEFLPLIELIGRAPGYAAPVPELRAEDVVPAKTDVALTDGAGGDEG